MNKRCQWVQIPDMYDVQRTVRWREKEPKLLSDVYKECIIGQISISKQTIKGHLTRATNDKC